MLASLAAPTGRMDSPRESTCPPDTSPNVQRTSDTARRDEIEKFLSRGAAIDVTRKTGVYCLLFQDAIVYIGQSEDVEGRIAAHRKRGAISFDRVVWFSVAPSDLDAYEGALVRHLNPPRTGTAPGDDSRDLTILATLGLSPNTAARSEYERRRRALGACGKSLVVDEDKIRAIRVDYDNGMSRSALAEKYNLTVATVVNIGARRTARWVSDGVDTPKRRRFAYPSKLSEKDVLAIRADADAGMRVGSLAEKYGVTNDTAWRIATRRTWRHLENPASEGT